MLRERSLPEKGYQGINRALSNLFCWRLPGLPGFRPGAGLVCRLGFGWNASPLGSPRTNAQGGYVLTYDPGATAVNLELRIEDVGVAAGMADKDLQTAQEKMKTLQRVYQITPSNESMPVLMSLGMTSATMGFARGWKEPLGAAPHGRVLQGFAAST